jgi:hypothetical protein
LGELNTSGLGGKQVTVLEETARRVVFQVAYKGEPSVPSGIVERYVITAGRIELTTEVQGYKGPLRYVWPVLANDGRTRSHIQVRPKGKVSVSQGKDGAAQTFTAVGATSVRVEPEVYPNHNGWARLAVAEFPAGTKKATLIIVPGAGPSSGH